MGPIEKAISKTAAKVARSLKGKVVRFKHLDDPYLGLGGDADAPDIAYAIGYQHPGGFMLSAVIAGYEGMDGPFYLGVYDAAPEKMTRGDWREAIERTDLDDLNPSKITKIITDINEQVTEGSMATSSVNLKKRVIATLIEAERPDLANAVSRMVSAGPDTKLSSSLRSKINKDLLRAGFDGNGRFKRMGEAMDRATDIFQKHGIETFGPITAGDFHGDKGNATFNMAMSNPEAPADTSLIKNSLLAVQWAMLEDGRFEVLMYMS